MERFSLRVYLEEKVSLCLGPAVIRLLVMKHRAVLSSLLKPVFHGLRHPTAPYREQWVWAVPSLSEPRAYRNQQQHMKFITMAAVAGTGTI